MIVVGTTTVPWRQDGTECNWLENAEAMIQDSEEELVFFAALEVDSRGLEPFGDLLRKLRTLPCDIWTFSIDDNTQKWQSEINGTRLMRIATGRNMITEYAHQRRAPDATHILFLDADVIAPYDCVNKLLALDWPMCGGNVPTYCLSGPEVSGRPVKNNPLWPRDHYKPYDFPVQQLEYNTAGFMMVARPLFNVLRWRWDWDKGLSDDPCYCADARTLGFPTYVRMDTVASHPNLYRAPGDLEIHR